MTSNGWWALENACVTQRVKNLGVDYKGGTDSPLFPIFVKLLEIPEIGKLLQRAVLEAEFGSDTEDFPKKLIHWVLSHLSMLDQDSINQATPLLSEVAGTSLTIRCKPQKIQHPDYRLETAFYEIKMGEEPSQLPSQTPDAGFTTEAIWPNPSESPGSDFGWENNFKNAQTLPDRQIILATHLDNLTKKVGGGLAKDLADKEFAALRLAGATQGFTITPTFWNYSDPFTFKDLTPEQVSKARKSFASECPLGEITNGTIFGLEAGGTVYRDPVLQISLGPKIPGMDGCLGIIKAKNSPELEPVRLEMANWPSYILQGTFKDKLRQFYIDIHGKLGEAWRLRLQESFLRFREHLLEVIQSCCKLRAFFPTHRNQYEQHFIKLVGNNAPRTGNVIRVHVPGLQDEQNCLILPALVEVD